MALRGIAFPNGKKWFQRSVVGPVASTASQAPVHWKPIAQPTDITAASGDQYFDSTSLAPVHYNGAAWMHVPRRRVLASSGNTTMTAEMNGSLMLVDGASTDYTLPAISAATDLGLWFDFLFTIISTGTQTITAGAADLLLGYANVVDTSADIDTFIPDASDDLIMTVNGTTTGGKMVGSQASYFAITSTRWWVAANLLTAAETQAIPFS